MCRSTPTEVRIESEQYVPSRISHMLLGKTAPKNVKHDPAETRWQLLTHKAEMAMMPDNMSRIRTGRGMSSAGHRRSHAERAAVRGFELKSVATPRTIRCQLGNQWLYQGRSMVSAAVAPVTAFDG